MQRLTRRHVLRAGASAPGVILASSLLGGFLARGAAGGAAAADALGAPVVVAHSGAAHTTAAMPPPNSPPIAPFATPLPIPPVLSPARSDATTDYYHIAMKQGMLNIFPGKTTTIWGYNGLYPGPTIRATSGRRVVVTQTNLLPDDLTVHLHGGHVPGSSDGHPNVVIGPGGSRDYIYPNDQIASTLWYHDHRMMTTAEHVWNGLAGFYLLGDATEAGFSLPSGAYDIPLMIQDRAFNPDGSLYYPASGNPDTVQGFPGDLMLVNGAVQPVLQVARRKYRFRLLNAANFLGFTFELKNGAATVAMAQIATDGGLIAAPISRSSITLWPAERAEVVIDFSAFPIGTQLALKNTAGPAPLENVMRFDVNRDEADGSSLPGILRPFAPIPTGGVPTRDWALGFRLVQNTFVINNQTYDPARIDATPTFGSTEIWRFTNNDARVHPMHFHQTMFQILDRNGVAPTAGSGEVGWKDTVAVNPGETVRTIARFTDYSGTFVLHCHRLQHEDHEMMAQFNLVGTHTLTLTPVAGGGAAANPPGPNYSGGSVVGINPSQSAGNTFTGWTVDGMPAGWASNLQITMDANHTVAPAFAATPVFCDVNPGDVFHTAVIQLAARQIIKGYGNGCYGPGDTTQRSQMAALICRAMGWESEDHGNPFSDQNGCLPDLWRNVGTLAFYGVAFGYTLTTFGPFDLVTQAQTISFLTRAMVKKGYWVQRADNPAISPNVPASSGHRADITTFVTYSGALPDAANTAATWGSWSSPATRAWFARAEWQGLNSYFGVDRVP